MNGQPMSSEGEFTALRDRNNRFRTESRYKCPLAAIAYLRREGNSSDGQELIWLANLSHHGLAFFSTRMFETGTPLVIHIPALPEQRRELQARVVHSTQQINDDYLIGCRLEQALTLDELEQCLTFDLAVLDDVVFQPER